MPKSEENKWEEQHVQRPWGRIVSFERTRRLVWLKHTKKGKMPGTMPATQ